MQWICQMESFSTPSLQVKSWFVFASVAVQFYPWTFRKIGVAVRSSWMHQTKGSGVELGLVF